MNLGTIYLWTALLILAGSLLIPLFVAMIVHTFKKWSWGLLISLSLLLSCVLVVVGLETLHRPIFVAWHRMQNPIVPKTGCVRYDPNFTQLFAVYRMSRPAFDRWAAECPWKLSPENMHPDYILFDQPKLGFGTPSAAYATESTESGKHLSVYYENGTMYLAYYSM